jgi:hypothetical protein
MNQNCLANTGLSIATIVACATVVLAVAVAVFLVRSRRVYRAHFVVVALLLVAQLVLGVSPAAFAATENCTAPQAVADSTSGEQGKVQGISVVLNDTPSPGSRFVLSSLRLALPENPPAGSVLSSNGKTATLPPEGTYVADNTGTITYTPKPRFCRANAWCTLQH